MRLFTIRERPWLVKVAMAPDFRQLVMHELMSQVQYTVPIAHLL